MKEVIYSAHLEFRLKVREIPYSLPLSIYKTAKEHYYDKLTDKYVAATKLKFK